jgi:hypothetical protein
MDISRVKIAGRVEEVVVREQGPWHSVMILGWDQQPRTVWKFPDLEAANAKAKVVTEWMEAGKLW